MKVMVTGSRGWTDERLVDYYLDELLDRAQERGEEFEIMHGGADGADIMAYWWALDRSPEVRGRAFLPDNRRPSPQRFHERNDRMLDQADYVIAFWDGKSRGTMHTVAMARSVGKPVEVIE